MADNLLDKASILLTPTAYNDGSMLSVKPENGDGDFTFSRSSAATRVNAQGLVENVQIISSELVSNGNFSQIGTEEVSNGNFSQEGSELITNGDFSNGSTDWSLIGDVSISNGVATFLDSGSNTNSRLIQTSISIGNSYKVTFEVTRYVNGRVQVVLGSGTTISVDISSGVGTYTIYGVSSGGSQFELKRNGNYPNFDFDIDNVSVKEVGQDWVLETGWSIGEDKAVANVIGTQAIYQSGITLNKWYKATYTISDYVSGDIRVRVGTSSTPTVRSSNGTFTEYLYATGVDQIRISPFTGGFIGSITNISVKEVGQDWTLGTGWSIGENELIATSMSNQFVTQSLTFTSGKRYRASFSVAGTSSLPNNASLRLPYDGSTSNIAYVNQNSDGVYSHEFISNGSSTLYLGYGSFTGSITNISVKEITDDTDLPRINYEGFSYQDSLGSEEIVNGGFDTNLNNWVAYSNTLISWESGGYALLDSNNNYWCKIKQSNVFEIGKTYKVILTAKSDRTDLSFHNSPITGSFSEADTFETFEQYYTATTTDFLFGYANVGSATITIDNVSVKEVLGQEVVPDSGCGSWLLEPQSTNLITQSELFSDSYWAKTDGLTVSSLEGGLSPNGVNNADLITVNNGRLNKDFSVINSTAYVLTAYYKGAVGDTLNMDLGAATKVVTLTGEWQKESISLTTTSTFIPINLIDNRTSGTALTVEVWGAQLENLSSATSYIPTNGATSTRLQDIANNSGNSTLINSAEGVLYAEIAALANYNLNRWISLNDGTTSNVIKIGFLSSSTNYTIVVEVISSAVLSTYMTYNFGAVEPTFVKVAFKYKENDFALWINGAEVATDTSGSTPIGLNKLAFDRGDGGQKFEGKAKAVAVFPILTNAQIQSLTTQ